MQMRMRRALCLAPGLLAGNAHADDIHCNIESGYDLDIKHPNAVQEDVLEAPPVILAQIEKDLADLVALVGRMKAI